MQPTASKPRDSPSDKADAPDNRLNQEDAADPTVATLTALLNEVSTSIGGVVTDLMNFPCPDRAGRGRFVARLSQIQAKINAQFGLKKRVR